MRIQHGRKVSKSKAKPALKSSRKPAAIDASTVLLFSRPSDYSWIADIDGVYWLVETGKSGLILCGYCRLSVDSTEYNKRRDLCQGIVRVVQERDDETCILGFSDWSGETLNRFVEVRAKPLIHKSAKWVSGYNPDGWIDVDAVLRVEGAKAIELELFLPEVEEPHAIKSLEFLFHGETISSVELTRGEVQRVYVPTAMAATDSIEILIESEYAEDTHGTGDERLLGCVVTGVSLVSDQGGTGAA